MLLYSDFSLLYVKRALVLLVRKEAERSSSSLCNSIESFHAGSNPAIKLSRKFSFLILPWAPIHALWYTVNSCSYLATISLFMRLSFCVSPCVCFCSAVASGISESSAWGAITAGVGQFSYPWCFAVTQRPTGRDWR